MYSEHMDGEYLVRQHQHGMVERILVSPVPEPGPDLRPQVVVTGISSQEDIVVEDMRTVTCATETQLAVSVEIRDPITATVLPVDQTFRLPFRARDGRERILLAVFTAGAATITTTVGESGCWQIREETINSGLPPEQHMQFAGLDIYVIQT
ncbi:MAG: hypothetical protein ACK4KV_18955 [Rhodocyclaceae bacterium]